MKMNYYIMSLCIVLLSSCVKMQPIDLGDDIWIGKWNNDIQHFEIGENGYGEWSVVPREGEGTGLLKNRISLVGKVDISDNEIVFKQQRFINIEGIGIPAGATKKNLNIDKQPIIQINQFGEPEVVATLNGQTFTKTL